MNRQRRSPGRRSGTEAARTRARILDRAQRLFARKGYRGVSMRELAAACGVRLFTVQHHFGSKLRLYEEILSRWDEEVRALLARVFAESLGQPDLLDRAIDQLFDFFLANRERVQLNARAVLGEGLSARNGLPDRSWVRFVDAALRSGRISASNLDIPMLLITVEGILNNHVLSAAHYRQLYGRDVTDPELSERTKTHLKKVIRGILEGGSASGAAPRFAAPRRARAGSRAGTKRRNAV